MALLALSFLQAPHLSAQSRIDSLKSVTAANKNDSSHIEAVLQLAIATREVNIDSAKLYFRKALSLSSKLGYPKASARALNGLGICHGMLDEYADAIRAFSSALKIATTNHLPLQAGDSYNSLGIVYKSLGDYSTSLAFYARGLHLYDSLNNPGSVASSHDNMGILYDLMKEPAQAKSHYEKALAIYTSTGDDRRATSVRSNMALLYLGSRDFDKAIEIFDQNLSYYASNGMRRYEAEEALNLGTAYLQSGRLAESKKVLERALLTARQSGRENIEIEALCMLSKLMADKGDSRAAIQTATNAVSRASINSSVSLLSKAFETLSYAFEKSGDMHRALENLKLHQAYEDSVFSESKSQAFMRQQVLMDVRDKDRKIQDQATQLALRDQQILLETRWKLTLGIATFLLLLAGLLYYQKYRSRIQHSRELERQNRLITDQNEEIEIINQQLQQQMVLRKQTDDTINYFATSLFGKNTIDEILWDVAKNCISRLGLVDCVIYLLDTKRDVLVQKAAFGTKNPSHFFIHDPIEIPLGNGIVGSVARTGMAELVNDTTADARYIVDDQVRYAELAVPLIIQNKVIGVIDTEHPDKNFFTQYHLESLTTIAAICSAKIAQAEADSRAHAAREIELEAEQIKALDKIRSQFFANISHEFRTPLNLILAPLQQSAPLSPEEIAMMTRNAKRLLRLVNQLLDLAKIEVGMLQTVPSYVNVFAYVSEIANAFSLIADVRETEYEINIPAYDLVAWADIDKVEKIMYNLLSNAFKFTPKGGRVVVEAFEESGKLQISVRDNGVGVPEHLHDQIFNRFYQVDGSQTRTYEGSGIGLALTKELVELMQGTIAVSSEHEKGCQFTVSIPLSAESTTVRQDEAALTNYPLSHYYPDGAGDKVSPDLLPDHDPTLPLVLLVEDNGELREYISTCLAPKYNVIAAPDGEQGLTLAEQRVPDLIISDIMMPRMDGVTLTKRLRSDDRTNHIPIILLTARDDIESKINGFETGAEQYLVKPFEVNELLARIQSLLTRQERLRKKFSGEIFLQPADVLIPDRDAVFLQKLIGVVESNIAEKSFSVDQLQREVGMSRMQLHRKLKALTNQSASDFIRAIRLKRAAQLLRQPGMQVADAAYLSGFNHLSYFSKCFKEEYGILPSDYIKSPVKA